MKWFFILPAMDCSVVGNSSASCHCALHFRGKKWNSINQNGFCSTNSSNALFIAGTLFIPFQCLVHLGFVIVFCILTSIYIKKNVLMIA